MVNDTVRFIEIPTPDGISLVSPKAITAIYTFQDKVESEAKSWVRLTGEMNLKSTATVQELKELLEKCNDQS